MCAGIWHRQVFARPTHFIHPCWQPVYYSHSAVGTCLPNTLPKQRLLFETRVQPLPYNYRPHLLYTCTNKLLWLLTSAPRSALCHSGHCHRRVNGPGKILTAHQPARQYALSNSHSRPRRSKVKCHLTCFEHLLSICFSFSDSLICSFVAIFTGFDTKVGIHAGQIRALSLQPYMTISIAFTLTISTT